MASCAGRRNPQVSSQCRSDPQSSISSLIQGSYGSRQNLLIHRDSARGLGGRSCVCLRSYCCSERQAFGVLDIPSSFSPFLLLLHLHLHRFLLLLLLLLLFFYSVSSWFMLSSFSSFFYRCFTASASRLLSYCGVSTRSNPLFFFLFVPTSPGESPAPGLGHDNNTSLKYPGSFVLETANRRSTSVRQKRH